MPLEADLESERQKEVYVLDTSSLVWIRTDSQIPRKHWKHILAGLTQLVEDKELVFSKYVLSELRRYHDKSDQLLAWAEQNARQATRFGDDYDVVKEVLDIVPDVLDAEKTTEEADPYVLALALSRKRSGDVVAVLNEERRDRPEKRSMTTACGDLWLIPLPMRSLLMRKGIWTKPAR